jgi:hypothetical protein
MVELELYENIDIQDKEIIEYLRRGKGSKRSKKKLLAEEFQKQIFELKIKAQSLLDPKAIYEIIDSDNLPIRDCFKEADKVAFGLVTIGKKLPEKVNKLLKAGKLVEGVILDAIGSASVETIADMTNEVINKEGLKMGLQFSERFSPGYCQWDVKDQEIIFNYINGDKIGVSLTKSFLMTPIKSISFAVNLGNFVLNSKWENRCKYCEIGDCSYRRA